MPEFLIRLFEYLKTQIPALAVGIYDYMQNQISKQKLQTDEKQLELDIRDNHDQVDKENSGKSDADIVADAIRKGAEPK